MKMLNFASIMLIVLSVSTITYCNQVSYDNYKVFRIIPATNQQIAYLRKLENEKGYSFWILPRMLLRMIDLQVAPTHLEEFYILMKNERIKYKLLIENMQELIDKQISTFEYRAGDDEFDFTRYHKLEEINTWMDWLASTHSRTVKKIVGGSTYQGRQIQGVRLRFGEQKPGIFIEGGIHPREWLSPATVVYLIHELLNSQASRVRALAERYDWYIFPICNPDGYVHTHTVDRMWRKSLSDTGMGLNPENADCKGVDLNRNFGYMWQEEPDPITDPCDESYPGPTAFSEIETQTLSEFIRSLRGKLFAYLSFHSYSQLLMFPYGYTDKHLDNYDDALAIGSRAVKALSRRYGTYYEMGIPDDVLYIASGISMDWAKGVMNLDLCFTYEMRDNGISGFLLPPEQIIPNGEEVLDSIVAMFEKARRLGYPKKQRSCSSSVLIPGKFLGITRESKKSKSVR